MSYADYLRWQSTSEQIRQGVPTRSTDTSLHLRLLEHSRNVSSKVYIAAARKTEPASSLGVGNAPETKPVVSTDIPEEIKLRRGSLRTKKTAGRQWTYGDPAMYEDVSDSDDDVEGLSDADIERRKAHRQTELAALITVNNFLYEDMQLDPSDPEDRKTILAFRSVKATSGAGYISMLRQILGDSIATGREGTGLTKDDLTTHLEKRNLKQGTYQQYSCALDWYLKATKQFPQGDPETVFTKAVIKGLRLRAKSANVGRRGGITYAMTRDVIGMKNLHQDFRDAFILLHATGVRINQLERMTLSGVEGPTLNKDGKRVWHITVPRNFKGRQQTTHDDEFEIHHTWPEWENEIARILDQVRQRGGRGTIVGAKWKPAQARKIIKQAAKKFSWPAVLQWCLHSFRHGACIDAYMASKGLTPLETAQAIRNVSQHLTLECLRAYGEPNEDRIRHLNLKYDDAYLRKFNIVSDRFTQHNSPVDDAENPFNNNRGFKNRILGGVNKNVWREVMTHEKQSKKAQKKEAAKKAKAEKAKKTAGKKK